jgi:hypothetical protein
MPTILIRRHSPDAHHWLGCRAGAALLACLMLALVSSVPAPAHAQVAPDFRDTLSALDTPTDDLIRLATEYPTALRDLKAAKLSIDTVQTLRPNAVVTNLEVQIATLNLEAAERKVQVLRAIVEKQLAAAENKLEVHKYLETLGGPPVQDNAANGGNRNFMRANDEATVRILRAILEMK